MSLSNGTSLYHPALANVYPFYYSHGPTVFPGIPDEVTALAAPIVTYWIASAIFHVFDISGWKWLDNHRIHDSAEVASRNLVTRPQVVVAVVFQQALQTMLGYVWMATETHTVDHVGSMKRIATFIENLVVAALGARRAHGVLTALGPQSVYFTYWWFIPAVQLFIAMFVMDTWQYFLHRAMHVNRFFYKHLHSVHHRLYVPYAFGALYNHPLEGFILDSLGAVLSETASQMSVRQTAFFFALSSSKTVDDHCGYRFPLDPLQMFSGNTADYHDIHHQVIGIKSNFSQPFFVHWDVILGTRMTRKDIEDRRAKVKHS
ncbi:sphingosine hydroxylase [Auriscalpium vulgare]|uniref:Sphingosine hydroxylase n=1 Tax=Auriscalpium vulgare TaxID=40419 RepID=A0ACB8RTQ5_9AGAM|nr:sphingosine hydroxylase [Auriscalpium vulgare]